MRIADSGSFTCFGGCCDFLQNSEATITYYILKCQQRKVLACLKLLLESPSTRISVKVYCTQTSKLINSKISPALVRSEAGTTVCPAMRL